jgi:hypothetical protein
MVNQKHHDALEKIYKKDWREPPAPPPPIEKINLEYLNKFVWKRNPKAMPCVLSKNTDKPLTFHIWIDYSGLHAVYNPEKHTLGFYMLDDLIDVRENVEVEEATTMMLEEKLFGENYRMTSLKPITKGEVKE